MRALAYDYERLATEIVENRIGGLVASLLPPPPAESIGRDLALQIATELGTRLITGLINEDANSEDAKLFVSALIVFQNALEDSDSVTACDAVEALVDMIRERWKPRPDMVLNNLAVDLKALT